MKKTKIIIGLGLIICVQLLYAQNVPVPIVHWTFDKTLSDFYSKHSEFQFKARDNNNSIITNIYGQLNHPGGRFLRDRHNVKSKAFSLDNNASIVFSNLNATNTRSKFFGLSKYNADPDAFTISIWIKFTASQRKERLLFGAKESLLSDSNVKFGISLKEETLYLKQYFEPVGTNNIGKAWKYKLIAPAKFDAGYGWYHLMVVFSKTQKYMRVFLGKPNGGAEYGPGTSATIPGNNKIRREFDGRLIWIPGIRDKLKDFDYWFLGNTSDLIFDDLMIFDKALTLDEAKALYNNQKPSMGSRRTKRSSGNIVADEVNERTTNSLKIFPNPSSGLTKISFKTTSSGIASLTIANLLGKTIYSRRFEVSKGSNELLLNIVEIGFFPGLYFVNLKTPNGVNMNKKLVVK